jgi:hypothetical protein
MSFFGIIPKDVSCRVLQLHFFNETLLTAQKVEELSRRLDERDSEPEVVNLQEQLSTANATTSRLETEVRNTCDRFVRGWGVFRHIQV